MASVLVCWPVTVYALEGMEIDVMMGWTLSVISWSMMFGYASRVQ